MRVVFGVLQVATSEIFAQCFQEAHGFCSCDGTIVLVFGSEHGFCSCEWTIVLVFGSEHGFCSCEWTIVRVFGSEHGFCSCEWSIVRVFGSEQQQPSLAYVDQDRDELAVHAEHGCEHRELRRAEAAAA
jgi:hypothetical protein